MLVSFTVGNYLSFKEKITFSLEAEAFKEHSLANTVSLDSFSGIRVLKSAALYGANSSGKSNLLTAINFVIRFIRDSAKESQIDDPIDVTPFKLSTQTEGQPSYFEIKFIVNDVLYKYGFEVDQKSVQREWLFQRKKVKEFELFERSRSKYRIDEKFSEGEEIKLKTRPNALFLSAVAQWNGKISSSIIESLKRFVFLGDSVIPIMKSAEVYENNKYKKAFIKFIRSADLGFSDFDTETTSLDASEFRNLPAEIKAVIAKQKMIDISVKTKHYKYDSNNKIVEQIHFDLKKEESLGTQKFFSLVGYIVDALHNGKILLIDEFSSRLHPLLTQLILKKFNSIDYNSSNAQLIFASHNTYLMEKKLLRRDQIFLVRKNEKHATELTTLFKEGVRNDGSYSNNYFMKGFKALPKINEDSQGDIDDQLNLFDKE